jgi:hypothetical protein
VLPLQLSKVGSYSYPEQDGFYQSAQQNLLIGWNAPNDLLDQVTEFRATAHYHGAKLVQLNLTPDPNKTVTLQYEDLQLELSPIPGQPFSYLLKARGGDKHWLHRRYDGAEGAMVQYLPPPATGPDWLTPAEQNMLALTSSAQYESTTQFTFAAEPPMLTLYVNTASANSELTKQIRFIPAAEYAQNVAYPPAQQQLLYSEDMYAPYDNQPQTATPVAPALLEPQIVAKYGVSLQLTSEQVAVCTLSVVDAPKVNGHTLQWTQISTNTGFGSGPEKRVLYQLSSADGIRRNFYAIKVSSALACTGTPQWQAVAYQPELSWLIDISQLPDLDTTQTVADFMRRYRFLNAQDLPLAPLVRDNGSEFYQRPLQQVLHHERWLVLAGRAAQIEHLTISGEPVNKQWVNTFPALP